MNVSCSQHYFPKCLYYFVKYLKSIQNLIININRTKLFKFDFLIGTIFVQLGAALVFQQTIGFPVCSNCAPVLADLFLRA